MCIFVLALVILVKLYCCIGLLLMLINWAKIAAHICLLIVMGIFMSSDLSAGSEGKGHLPLPA